MDVGTSTPLSTIPSEGGDVGGPEGFGAYETNHLKTRTKSRLDRHKHQASRSSDVTARISVLRFGQ
jgi:hypothetical protein